MTGWGRGPTGDPYRGDSLGTRVGLKKPALAPTPAPVVCELTGSVRVRWGRTGTWQEACPLVAEGRRESMPLCPPLFLDTLIHWVSPGGLG